MTRHELKMVYVAHKFSGDLANADRAEKWTAWLNLVTVGAVFFCPWVPLVRNWPDSGETRARGLELDLECCRRFDGVIALTAIEGGVKDEVGVSRAHLQITVGDHEMGQSADDTFGVVMIVQSWINSLGPVGIDS